MITIRVARTVAELERLRPVLDDVAWGRFEADPDYLLSAVATRDTNPRPFVVVAESGGIPLATFASIVEDIRLAATFGYRTVAKPRLRAIVGAHGGCIADHDDAATLVLGAVGQALRSGEADALWCPSLPLDAYPHRLPSRLGPRLLRPGFAKTWTHRRLPLPDTYDAFLQGLRKATRADLRRDRRRLEEAFGDRLRIVQLHGAGTGAAETAVALERVAARTYQRGLGAGFVDSPEQRGLIAVGLGRGMFRAWTLEVDGEPVAYWQGCVYGRSYVSSATGYDPAFGRHRVGMCLLTYVVEDLCADPLVDRIDWGFGDAEYKRLFSAESFEERDLVVLAPTLKGLRVSATRAAVLGASTMARRIADTLGVTGRIKREWRRRRRPDRARDEATTS